MSKKNTGKNPTKKNGSVLGGIVKVAALMIGCTVLSLLTINLLATYQLGASLLIGAIATIAIIK